MQSPKKKGFLFFRKKGRRGNLSKKERNLKGKREGTLVQRPDRGERRHGVPRKKEDGGSGSMALRRRGGMGRSDLEKEAQKKSLEGGEGFSPGKRNRFLQC